MVCEEEAAEEVGGRRGRPRDTESKTRTPHKVVGKNIALTTDLIFEGVNDC
jgi:hypothetical protein